MNNNDAIGLAGLILGVLFYLGALLVTTLIGNGFGILYLKVRNNSFDRKQRSLLKKMIPIFAPATLWIVGYVLFISLRLSDATDRDEFIILPFYLSVPFITAMVYVWSVRSGRTTKRF